MRHGRSWLRSAAASDHPADGADLLAATPAAVAAVAAVVVVSD